MKNIDIKSLIIGVLLATTIIFGMGATGKLGNGPVKIDGPVDVRLSFGSSKATASNTSTPTELDNLDTLNVKLSGGIYNSIPKSLKLSGAVVTD